MYPTYTFDAPVCCDPSRISSISLTTENWSPWDIVWYCAGYLTFSRFGTMPVSPACVGRTDGQTDRRTQLGYGVSYNLYLSKH